MNAQAFLFGLILAQSRTFWQTNGITMPEVASAIGAWQVMLVSAGPEPLDGYPGRKHVAMLHVLA